MENPMMKLKLNNVIQNTNRPGGWKKFKDLAEENIELEKNVRNADDISSTEMK